MLCFPRLYWGYIFYITLHVNNKTQVMFYCGLSNCLFSFEKQISLNLSIHFTELSPYALSVFNEALWNQACTFTNIWYIFFCFYQWSASLHIPIVAIVRFVLPTSICLIAIVVRERPPDPNLQLPAKDFDPFANHVSHDANDDNRVSNVVNHYGDVTRFVGRFRPAQR